MTQAQQAHNALIDAYIKRVHEDIEIMAREVKQAVRSAQSEPGAQDRQADLFAQLRAKADRIEELETDLASTKMLLDIANRNRTERYGPEQVPPPGRYIVRNKSGATFFFEPINGKWPEWVLWWMKMPD